MSRYWHGPFGPIQEVGTEDYHGPFGPVVQDQPTSVEVSQGTLVLGGLTLSPVPALGSLALAGQTVTASVTNPEAPALGTITLGGFAVTISVFEPGTPWKYLSPETRLVVLENQDAKYLQPDLGVLNENITSNVQASVMRGTLALAGLTVTAPSTIESEPARGTLALGGLPVPAIEVPTTRKYLHPVLGSLFFEDQKDKYLQPDIGVVYEGREQPEAASISVGQILLHGIVLATGPIEKTPSLDSPGLNLTGRALAGVDVSSLDPEKTPLAGTLQLIGRLLTNAYRTHFFFPGFPVVVTTRQFTLPDEATPIIRTPKRGQLDLSGFQQTTEVSALEARALRGYLVLGGLSVRALEQHEPTPDLGDLPLLGIDVPIDVGQAGAIFSTSLTLSGKSIASLDIQGPLAQGSLSLDGQVTAGISPAEKTLLPGFIALQGISLTAPPEAAVLEITGRIASATVADIWSGQDESTGVWVVQDDSEEPWERVA